MIKDGDWELFSHDPKLGRTVWRYFDGKGLHFRTDYQVDRTLELNKQAFNESQGARWNEGRRVASIPLNIYYDQLEEAQSQNDEKYLSKWLNNGDNRRFRTFEGDV